MSGDLLIRGSVPAVVVSVPEARTAPYSLKNKHPQSVRAILRRLDAEYPETQTALTHESPFQLLVATILSAQCTDARVNQVTPPLFAAFRDAAAFAALDPEELEPYIESCGLYRSKARNIVAASRMIVDEFSGCVPDNRADLTRLPGVGRKTANVVLANVFSEPAIAVDTHVFRVARRLGLATGRTPDAVEKELMEVLPREEWSATHYRLILHGRTICKARNPACDVCPLTRWCDDWRRRQDA